MSKSIYSMKNCVSLSARLQKTSMYMYRNVDFMAVKKDRRLILFNADSSD